MIGLKLIYVSKSGSWCVDWSHDVLHLWQFDAAYLCFLDHAAQKLIFMDQGICSILYDMSPKQK